ncbi:hypothetical protein SARC_08454 [Sphaeroforma arctica JP610]|uniref:Uncharacterized protein n=1 Tax=Sphaeroforma arctica JP610 TaxID=667725 RepID=A0A0L0FT61_9EUKA|nr:hypothetical protein SARC_08454 [Sphaeroforma arctica JP610]KNC79138.1 hypothetical protein SARC_08454 [Sphaeroforma arctica JP610]|eukprot:XP_014153040.1 hypothetical protein SARC_08454 [Sphaeroforma arctica JP610]
MNTIQCDEQTPEINLLGRSSGAQSRTHDSSIRMSSGTRYTGEVWSVFYSAGVGRMSSSFMDVVCNHEDGKCSAKVLRPIDWSFVGIQEMSVAGRQTLLSWWLTSILCRCTGGVWLVFHSAGVGRMSSSSMDVACIYEDGKCSAEVLRPVDWSFVGVQEMSVVAPRTLLSWRLTPTLCRWHLCMRTPNLSRLQYAHGRISTFGRLPLPVGPTHTHPSDDPSSPRPQDA